jgi:hypothetical protein
MKRDINQIFKTAPKETFQEFLRNRELNESAEARYNEALKIVESAGYQVLNEAAFAKWLAGLALSFGLLTHAQAAEFNQRTPSGYTSKANTSMFAKDFQKRYNMNSNIQVTDAMVQQIADDACQKLTKRMTDENKYELEDLIKLPEFNDMVSFYKTLKKADESLANMFSRRLDKALTKSLSIAPNIQRFAEHA